jgi:hypothetical protein
MVEGARARPAGPNAHVWLLVRPRVEGGRWYLYPEPIRIGEDGRWEAEMDLDGPAGVSHELLVGVADPDAHAALVRHVAEHRHEPLGELPDGFWDEANVVVTRR